MTDDYLTPEAMAKVNRIEAAQVDLDNGVRRDSPSEAALKAAVGRTVSNTYARSARRAVVRAHDPALGVDRSVCLRDVLTRIRCEGEWTSPETLAVLLEREFTSGRTLR